MDTAHVLGVVIVGGLAISLAFRALDHAATGYHRVRGGAAQRRRAETGMVWVLTLAALSAIATVMGGFLQALALLRG
jgi:hypothetical protein